MLNEYFNYQSNPRFATLKQRTHHISYICSMKTVIIGSGNVSYHLCKAFSEVGIPVSQIFGRNEQALKEIGELLKIEYSTTYLQEAHLYIIAVNDNSIAEVSSEIQHNGCLVAHTSGSMPKEILQGNYRKASFYPLQTFSKEKTLDYSQIPFFIEAENPQDQHALENLALKISKNVRSADFDTRKHMHLTAIFACNFVNHLFARAKEISDKKNIPFTYFQPLIEETVQKIKFLEPKNAQTGPAIRHDERVLKMHEELLCGTSLEIYKIMNTSIKEMYEL